MLDLHWKNLQESKDLFYNSVHRVCVKSGYEFPLHTHWNFHEAVIVFDGDIRQRVNDRIINQSSGELLFLPSESSHAIQSRGALFLNIILPLDWLEEGGINLPAQEPVLLNLKSEDLNYINTLYERYSRNTDPNLSHIQYFRMILILAEWLIRNKGGEDERPSQDEPEWFTRGRSSLASGDWQPESVAELADLCHISPEHLSRTWKALTGQSPVQYLQDLRLEKASRLLGLSNATVLEVAGQAGYDSPGYFFQKFRERYGMSPAQYRKQIRRYT